MRDASIDPASPVPLYYQIAELIRSRILSGELSPGDALHPLRSAAETWGVHLHTVRHAYAALSREGLIKIGRGSTGTRVAKQPAAGTGSSAARHRPDRGAELATFVQRFLREGNARFGADHEELGAAVREEGERSAASRSPAVYVTECSAHQCAAHAREIAARYAVDARPWPLENGEPPPGPVIATYFHYNDIRRLWPRRLRSVRFMTIQPLPAIKERLNRRSGTIRVCELDAETAEAVIGDLRALLGRTRLKLVPAVTQEPATLLRAKSATPVLYPPRVWARLDERTRQNANAIELVYALDNNELEQLAAESGWRGRSLSVAS